MWKLLRVLWYLSFHYFHFKHAINKQQQKQHTHLSIKHVHKSDVILMVQGIAGLSAVMKYLSKR